MYVFAALRAGAKRLPAQGHPAGRPAGRDRVVAAGDALLAPGVTRRPHRRVHPAPRPRQRPAAALEAITEREREVLTLIGLGLSNTEIASQLHVSLSTAKTHVGATCS